MTFTPAAINERKNKTAKSLDGVLGDDEVVLVHSGESIQKPGGHDQTYPFLPHPDYFWLTDSRRAHGVSAYSKHSGWIDFVLPITREEKIWEGGGVDPKGVDIATFETWLKNQKFRTIHSLGQHKDSYWHNPLKDEKGILEAFNEVRRIKDEEEIQLVRNIAQIAAKGYAILGGFIKSGVSEREIQIAYETEVLKAGSHKMPYETIVGIGTNSAVLHASPGSRVAKSGDLVLIDAGADIDDYCVDITRIFTVDSFRSSQQKSLFDIVLNAQKDSINLCRPGVEWKDVHLASARAIAQGLRDLNILKCSVEESIATGAVAVFFPHGVGHMVGLKVRDVGTKFNPNPNSYAGARLRVDMPLKENYMMTVEPGLYFIEALLNDSETRAKFKDAINWEEAIKWIPVGGVRLEDDIVIRKNGAENLTEFIPKN